MCKIGQFFSFPHFTRKLRSLGRKYIIYKRKMARNSLKEVSERKNTDLFSSSSFKTARKNRKKPKIVFPKQFSAILRIFYILAFSYLRVRLTVKVNIAFLLPVKNYMIKVPIFSCFTSWLRYGWSNEVYGKRYNSFFFLARKRAKKKTGRYIGCRILRVTRRSLEPF